MPTENEPTVGNWYKDLQGRSLEVVAVDDEEETVEVQYFGGEIEELSFDSWYDAELVTIEPPEDWSGPFDDLERDDLGDTEKPIHPEDWDGPWDDLDRKE